MSDSDFLCDKQKCYWVRLLHTWQDCGHVLPTCQEWSSTTVPPLCGGYFKPKHTVSRLRLIHKSWNRERNNNFFTTFYILDHACYYVATHVVLISLHVIQVGIYFEKKGKTSRTVMLYPSVTSKRRSCFVFFHFPEVS